MCAAWMCAAWMGAALSLPGRPGLAMEPARPAAHDQDEPTLAELDAQGQLTLAQARAFALTRNIPLLVARQDRLLGQVSARQARRLFVPVIQLAASWQDDTDLLRDGRNRSIAYRSGVDWRLPVGTSLSAQLGATHFLAGSSFAPTPASFLQLGVVQPLLRGLGRQATPLEQRDLDIELQRILFLNVLNDFLFELEGAYWELAFAQANLDISTRSRDRARQQFEDTRENINRRLLADGEIHIVEENLVFFEQQLVRSHESLELAQLRLARIMRAPEHIPWRAVDPLTTSVQPVPSADAMRDQALDQHPLILAQRVRSTQAALQTAVEQNLIRPSLDLSASLRLNGTDPSAASAWGQVATADAPDWRVGLQLEVPLDRDPDYARVERAQIEQRRQELAMRDARDRVRYGAREVFVRLTRQQEILVLAQRGVSLAELKLQTEQEKYMSGLSTLANVVLFQRDLDRARNAYQRAVADVLIARARYGLQLGDLYVRAGVRIP